METVEQVSRGLFLNSLMIVTLMQPLVERRRKTLVAVTTFELFDLVVDNFDVVHQFGRLAEKLATLLTLMNLLQLGLSRRIYLMLALSMT